MKKYIIASLAAIALASLSSALAQDTASHELQVTIPEVLGIRTQPTTDADLSVLDVVFDYADVDNQAAYLAVLATPGSGWLPATDYSLGDVEVLAAGTGWRVTVSTVGTMANTGIGLARLRVTPTSFGAFTLDSVANVATGSATTWQSIGISGASYELFVDGTETAGDDTITVTYSIFSN